MDVSTAHNWHGTSEKLTANNKTGFNSQEPPPLSKVPLPYNIDKL
jgi:hypothetical protein